MQQRQLATVGMHPTIAYDATDQRLWVTWQDDKVINLDALDPATLATLKTTFQIMAGAEASYPEVAYWGGLTYHAWRDGAPPSHGRVRHVVPGPVQTPEDLGPVHGARPMAFGAGFLAYIADGAHAGYPTNAKRLGTTEAAKYTRNAAGTGLSRVDPAGDWCAITTIDEDRFAVPGMADPAWAGPCVVGATDINGQPCLRARLGNGAECVFARGEDSQNPRIATDGRFYYVVAWSARGEGVRIWQLENADFQQPQLDYPGVPDDMSPPAAGEAKYLGYYYSNGKYGEFWPAQNCPVLGLGLYRDSDGHLPADAETKLLDAALRNHRFIALADLYTLRVLASEWSRCAAVMVGELDTPQQVRDAVAAAHRMMADNGIPKRPVMSTLTVKQTTDPAYRGTADIAGVEVYFDVPAPSFVDMELQVAERVDDIVAAHSGTRILPIGQAYDRSREEWKRNPGMLEAVQYATHEAMVDHHLDGVIWFAYGRPTGVVDHPELVPWHEKAVSLCDVPAEIHDAKPPDPHPHPPEDDVTYDDIHRYMGDLTNDILFGAIQRFHDEVLPRDRPLDPAIKSAAWPEFNDPNHEPDFSTRDVVTGGAIGFFVRSYVPEFIIARDKGRPQAQASGDAYDIAIANYRKAVGVPQ